MYLGLQKRYPHFKHPPQVVTNIQLKVFTLNKKFFLTLTPYLGFIKKKKAYKIFILHDHRF